MACCIFNLRQWQIWHITPVVYTIKPGANLLICTLAIIYINADKTRLSWRVPDRFIFDMSIGAFIINPVNIHCQNVDMFVIKFFSDTGWLGMCFLVNPLYLEGRGFVLNCATFKCAVMIIFMRLARTIAFRCMAHDPNDGNQHWLR